MMVCFYNRHPYELQSMYKFVTVHPTFSSQSRKLLGQYKPIHFIEKKDVYPFFDQKFKYLYE